MGLSGALTYHLASSRDVELGLLTDRHLEFLVTSEEV